jgi:4-diphosphocytidyl-2-C-methyl-D-erythritol kinase
MHSYSLIAPAKINLHLEIIGDRPDGYHELVMIMQSIELSDRLTLRANGTENIRIFCQDPQVPNDRTNLAYRAAELMVQRFANSAAKYGGVDIEIEKHIPVAAGLAGGSANAAAVLVGIDLMWELGLTQLELQELAAKLGSDIPFCVSGGTAIATGRGEVLAPIVDLDNIWVVLAKYRSLGVSTGWAYNTYRARFGDAYVDNSQAIAERRAKVHSGDLVRAIAAKNPQEIGKLLYNDLEKVVLPEYVRVAELKSAFQAANVLGTMMSGSGPTVFALCENLQQATAIKDLVRAQIIDPDLEFWITKLSSQGIHLGR